MAKRSSAPKPLPETPVATVHAIGHRICQFARGRDGCVCADKAGQICESIERVADTVARMARQA